jgi:hypothetical protein
MPHQVPWGILAHAQAYYKGIGYEYVETPWVVPLDIVRAMGVQKGVRDWTCPNGVLVGSAEQGFVYMLREGKLHRNGMYMSISPCFRVEPVVDDIHYPYFMKCELFVPVDSADLEDVKAVAEDALAFFETYANGKTPSIVRTRAGYDIMMDGVELGSYGYNEIVGTDLKWVYGTGVAEPRFNHVIRK